MSPTADTIKTSWSNPYPDIQRAARHAVNDGLRRTNGVVTPGQFAACTIQGSEQKAAKVRSRLFNTTDLGLEWKAEIQSLEDLERRLSGAKSINPEALAALLASSRPVRFRTEFPYIAPASKTSQHTSRFNMAAAPVFGVDVLIRPPAQFSEDRAGSALRNELTLGEECFALVAHGNFANGALLDDGSYLVRLVVGDAFAIPAIVRHMPEIAVACEAAMKQPLLDGETKLAVRAALPYLNKFGKAASDAFVI